ncbi:MAG: O-antigen ligase family protein [Gemmatimonadota bacterium]
MQALTIDTDSKGKAPTLVRSGGLFRLPIEFATVSALLLVFFNLAPPLSGAGARRLATIFLLLAGVMVALFLANKRIRVRSFPTIIFALYLAYIVTNIFVNGLFTGLSPFTLRDFAEVVRVLGLVIFFICGAALGYRTTDKGLTIYFVLISTILGVLIAEWLWFGGRSGVLSSFYADREGRFSGLMASVNYSWVPFVLTVGLFVVGRTLHYSGKWWGYCAVLTTGFALVLSASRTGLIAALILLVALAAGLRLSYTRRGGVKTLIRLILLTAVGVGTLYLYSPEQLGRAFRAYAELGDAIAVGALTEVASFQMRLGVWADVWAEVQERPFFGYGPNKSGVTITDNTYLMTLYRYGMTGLLLEFGVYFGFLAMCVKRLKHEVVMVTPITYLACFLAAGTTSSVFYELKTPYLLTLLLGAAVRNDPPSQRRTVASPDA